MRIGGTPAANQAWLLGNGLHMLPVANSTGHRQRQDRLLDRTIWASTVLSLRAARQHVRDLIELDERLTQDLYIPWRLLGAARIPEGAERFALVMSNLAPRLAVLERYRATSRRKRAFRMLVSEKRKSKRISDVGKSD
jgi:hypothetical protein